VLDPWSLRRHHRVSDFSRKKIKEGSLIRFPYQGDQILTESPATAALEMFDHESVTSFNPLGTRRKPDVALYQRS
jgi:hypothetical protein